MESSSTSAVHRKGVHPLVSQKRKAGRKKFHETHHPIYKGVRQRNGKWVCEIRQPNKSRLWVGTFSCPEMAARAYDEAAVTLRCESASLNFPEAAGCRSRGCGGEIEKEMEGSSGGETTSFVDEEELFNMPGLLYSMAEGLMLAPPAVGCGFDCWDGADVVDLSLWTD